jgi:RimJ/RimL family protein N-acetyltransferase
MSLTKRNASLSDAKVLLEWRNSPSVQKFSQKQELIQFEDHLVWLSKRLERVMLEPFYVFELGNQLVGMCRLDLGFQSPYEFVISILVDPAQQGKGIGTKILNMTCAVVFDSYPSSMIIANVHQNNSVSIKLFENNGFKLKKQLGDFLRFEKSL